MDTEEPDYSVHAPGWFDFSRHVPFPTQYAENKTPVTQDVLVVGIIVAFVTVFVSISSLLPSLHGIKQVIWFSRCTLSLGLGLTIMVCQFGQRWEVGIIETKTAYRAGTGQEIHANIGMWMGLRGVNITLKNTTHPEGDLSGETINYNERFFWTWVQGRPGFGPFAGEIQRQFRAAQYRGTPLPILWIAEYFTIDGEGLRWGRHYRQAGWYAHWLLWAALPAWLLSIILFKMVIKYGAAMLCLTGSFLLSAALTWAKLRNPLELKIPFEDANLVTRYGPHWYLALIVGSVCITLGILIYILDFKYHDAVSTFFTADPHEILELEYIDGEGEGIDSPPSTPTGTNQPTNAHEMEQFDQQLSAAIHRRQGTVRIRGRGTSDKNWQRYQVSGTSSNAFGQDKPVYSNVPFSGGPSALTHVEEDVEETPLALYSNLQAPPKVLVSEETDGQSEYQDATSLHVGDSDAAKNLMKHSTTKNEYNTFGKIAQDEPLYSNLPHNLSKGIANVLSEIQVHSSDSTDLRGSRERLINKSFEPDDDV